MRFQKLLSLLIIMIMTFCMSSCSSFRDELFARDDHKIADTRFDMIIDAIKNQDKDAIKGMFSVNALKEAKDIDGGIEYLFGFYKGEIVSSDSALSGGSSLSYGNNTSELDCMYLVTTDVDEYLIFCIDVIVDTQNPDNIGLYMLQIIKQADSENEFDWGTNIRCPGVYQPPVK